MPELDSSLQSPRAATRGFQPLRDLPSLFWLLLVFVVALIHRYLPAPGWLLLHLLFLGAITHAILVWSQHFSFALTRTPHTEANRRTQRVRLILANAGIMLVVVGVPSAIWALTVAGSTLLIGAVIWHGISIGHRLRRALPGVFTRTVRYYVVSAAFLPIGAALGAWIAGPGDPAGNLVLSHAIINVFGWVGITVAGTLVTLWPTMLRTRAADSAPTHAVWALPVLGVSVAVSALGAALGVLPAVAVGLAGYAAGLMLLAVSLVRAARQAAPRSFATLSVGAGLGWWIGGVAMLATLTIMAWVDGSGIAAVRLALDGIAPFLATGFAAQVLLGALSYLAPVSIGVGRARCVSARRRSTPWRRSGSPPPTLPSSCVHCPCRASSGWRLRCSCSSLSPPSCHCSSLRSGGSTARSARARRSETRRGAGPFTLREPALAADAPGRPSSACSRSPSWWPPSGRSTLEGSAGLGAQALRPSVTRTRPSRLSR